MTYETGTALVADDDELFRVALKSILRERLGYGDVIEAGSLDEALDRLGTEEDISVALFDLSMPGVESPANLRAVRECFPNTRVAVVSGSKRRRDILMAFDAGVHGYVPKSLGLAELTKALRAIAEGTIYAPQLLAEISADPDNRSDLPDSGPNPKPKGTAELTRRQRDVLALLVQGKSNKEIARALNLGEGTVKVHMAALFRTLGVSTRAAAAAAGSKLLSDT